MLMRKLLAILCIVLLVALPASAKPKLPGLPPQASEEIEIDIGKTQGKANGKSFNMPQAPFIQKGRTYIPVRSLSGLMGAQVDFKSHKGTDTIILTFADSVITIDAKTSMLTLGTVTYKLRDPIIMNRGTAFIPLAELADIVGYDVKFLPPGKVVLKKQEPVTGKPFPVSFEEIQPTVEMLAGIDMAAPGVTTKLVRVSGVDKLLVVVSRGAKPTAGYGLSVTSATARGSKVVLAAAYSDPSEGQLVAQVITNVYKAFLFEASYHGMQFVVETEPAEVTGWQNISHQLLAEVGGLDLTTPGLFLTTGSSLLASCPTELQDAILLVVKRGECNSGGHGIAVKSLVRVGDTLKVHAQAINPPPGSMVTMALTYPYQVIRIPAQLAHLPLELYLDGEKVQTKASKQ